MENKSMDESKEWNMEGKERIVLLKRILSPNEYRSVVVLSVIDKKNSIAGLTAPLKTNQKPEKDF